MWMFKGQMYSIIAILLIVPMGMFFSYYMMSGEGSNQVIYKSIVAEQIGVVSDSMESDFLKAMEISGKRAVIAAVNWQILRGKNLTEPGNNLTILMINGTINGSENLIMTNNTLTDWSYKISSVPTNFDSSISYEDLSITSEDFIVTITSDVTLSVSDDVIEMDMQKTIQKQANISIEEIDDPLYPLNTYGLSQRTILRYPYDYKARNVAEGGINSSGSCPGNATYNPGASNPGIKILVIEDSTSVSDAVLSSFRGVVSSESRNLTLIGVSCYVTGNESAYDTINDTMTDTGYDEFYIDNETRSVWHLPFREAVFNGYYFEGEGPNITNRMKNITNGSENGLESIVDIQELFMNGIQIKENRVSTDYLYFSSENYIGYEVRGFPGWFRLNCGKASEYGVLDLLEYDC